MNPTGLVQVFSSPLVTTHDDQREFLFFAFHCRSKKKKNHEKSLTRLKKCLQKKKTFARKTEKSQIHRVESIKKFTVQLLEVSTSRRDVIDFRDTPLNIFPDFPHDTLCRLFSSLSDFIASSSRSSPWSRNSLFYRRLLFSFPPPTTFYHRTTSLISLVSVLLLFSLLPSNDERKNFQRIFRHFSLSLLAQKHQTFCDVNKLNKQQNSTSTTTQWRHGRIETRNFFTSRPRPTRTRLTAQTEEKVVATLKCAETTRGKSKEKKWRTQQIRRLTTDKKQQTSGRAFIIWEKFLCLQRIKQVNFLYHDKFSARFSAVIGKKREEIFLRRLLSSAES